MRTETWNAGGPGALMPPPCRHQLGGTYCWKPDGHTDDCLFAPGLTLTQRIRLMLDYLDLDKEQDMTQPAVQAHVRTRCIWADSEIEVFRGVRCVMPESPEHKHEPRTIAMGGRCRQIGPDDAGTFCVRDRGHDGGFHAGLDPERENIMITWATGDPAAAKEQDVRITIPTAQPVVLSDEVTYLLGTLEAAGIKSKSIVADGLRLLAIAEIERIAHEISGAYFTMLELERGLGLVERYYLDQQGPVGK